MYDGRSYKGLIKRLLIRLFFLISIYFFSIYILPKMIQLFYPFILAFILAILLNPVVKRLNKWGQHFGIGSSSTRKIITFLITTFMLITIGLITYITLSILIKEIIELTTNIQNNWPTIVLFFENSQKWLIDKTNILPSQTADIMNNLTVSILESIRNISKSILNITVSMTGIIISRTGTFLFTFLTFFLSLYFILVDYNSIRSYIKRHLDQRLLNTIVLLRDSTLVALGGYLKTQLFFAIVSFLFMFIAFIFWGQEYSLILALLLGFVDLLPLIGTSAVLVPWGFFEITLGNTNKAIFLFSIAAVFFVFRRLAEPKIMGNQTGLHPLLALIGLYLGIQISGLWGAFIGPFIMIVIVSIINSGILDSTFNDLRAIYYIIVVSLQNK